MAIFTPKVVFGVTTFYFMIWMDIALGSPFDVKRAGNPEQALNKQINSKHLEHFNTLDRNTNSRPPLPQNFKPGSSIILPMPPMPMSVPPPPLPKVMQSRQMQTMTRPRPRRPVPRPVRPRPRPSPPPPPPPMYYTDPGIPKRFRNPFDKFVANMVYHGAVGTLNRFKTGVLIRMLTGIVGRNAMHDVLEDLNFNVINYPQNFPFSPQPPPPPPDMEFFEDGEFNDDDYEDEVPLSLPRPPQFMEDAEMSEENFDFDPRIQMQQMEVAGSNMEIGEPIVLPPKSDNDKEEYFLFQMPNSTPTPSASTNTPISTAADPLYIIIT